MPVDLNRNDDVAVLTLNRVEALNAMSPAMLDELEARLDEAESDASVGALVLTGAGEKAFCAGADVAHMQTAEALEARAFATRGHEVADRIEGLEKPVVAAVNGYALGGGCEIALACDVRIASERARFGQPEIGLGIVPGWGGTQRLAHIAGIGLAKEMILTGKPVSADDALRSGLVTHVEPPEELLPKAIEIAATMARQPAWALAAAKRLTNLATRAGGPSPFAREIDAFALAFTTPDQREGMAAFFEKRSPDFAGRDQKGSS